MLENKKESDTVFTDYMMNVTNSYTVNALANLNIQGITISLEATLENIKAIEKYVDTSKLVLFTYGHTELMKMKYNPVEKHGTHLVDRNHAEYRIKHDDTYHYLMSSKPVDLIDELNDYREQGIGYYRLDFTVESKDECAKILEKIHKILSKE